MARIVNPYNLDDEDDAVFAGALNDGRIWIEDDEDSNRYDKRKSKIDYLDTSGAVKIHTLKVHKKKVNAIVVNGDFVISASADKTLCVHDWKTGAHIRTLIGHGGSVNAVVVNEDFAISASDDGTVRVWNWKTGEHVRTLGGYVQKVSALNIDGNLIVSASGSEIWVWNWNTGELLQRLTGSHKDGVISTAIDHDLVMSLSPDRALVRDLKTGEHLHALANVPPTIKSDSMSLDKDYLVSTNGDSVDIWKWKTGKHLSEPAVLNAEYSQLKSRVFSMYSSFCVYSIGNHRWCFYRLDPAYDKGVLAEDYSHMITSDPGGWLYVVRMNPSLGHMIVKYTAEDVLQAARTFIQKRDEEWVNFSRVSQYLHERFQKIDLTSLAQPSKKYHSLVTFFAEYPADFKLRRDTKREGLYWISLKR